MTKIMLFGCSGAMGRTVAELCSADPELRIVAGVCRSAAPSSGFPVCRDPMEFSGTADCAVDFSNPEALDSILRWCVKTKTPAVLATTGYSPEQLRMIDGAALEIPIFRSANMSLGVNVLISLAEKAARILGAGWDVEIVERHHRRKLDAPSGTALMIADAVASALPYEAEKIFTRHDRREARPQNEIGISAVRGGSIVGGHELIFAGTGELIELRHSAQSREVFASGAVRAARFLAQGKAPGLYDMKDLVEEVI